MITKPNTLTNRKMMKRKSMLEDGKMIKKMINKDKVKIFIIPGTVIYENGCTFKGTYKEGNFIEHLECLW